MIELEKLNELFSDVFEKHKKHYPSNGWLALASKKKARISKGTIFVDESLDAFEMLISYITDKKFVAERYTKEDIQRMVQERINEGIEINEGNLDVPKEIIYRIVEELLKDLNQPLKKLTVVAPFNNIILKSEPYSVFNVRFYSHSEEILEKTHLRVRDIIRSNFQNRIVGEVDVLACTGKKAIELARREYGLAIAILRLIYPEATITFDRFFLIKQEGGVFLPDISKELDWDFDFRRFEKNVEVIVSLMKPLGSNENQTDLARRCLQALRWYGEAVRDNFPPDRFVKFITALEVLIVSGKSDKKCGLTEEFGENLSILFDDSRKSKEEVKKEMKKFYGLRSRIVHSGDFSNLKDENVKVVRDLCRGLILVLAENAVKFTSVKQFLNHVSDLRQL